MDSASRPVFALIIGIDSYQKHSRLNGAVADANAFECFLKEHFSSCQVINLRDAEATRKNIEAAFERFQRDPDIKRGDTIVIYFAGHGGRVPISDEWMGWKPEDSQIEIICPVDIGVGNGTAGKTIGGIPDLTVAIWLNAIAKEKGNNITLILDCCHSAGGNRCEDDATYVPRRISNPPDISLDDYKIWASHPETKNARSAGVPLAFVGQNQESHVLLAACGQKELAFENAKRGLFTRALLDVLGKSDLRSLTYESAIRKVEIPKFKNQNPQCQGRYRDRLIFSPHATRGKLSLIQGFREDNKIVLKAGKVHGIKESSHFAIYPGMASSLALCCLPVKSLMSTTSIISPPAGSESFDIPSPFYAREISKEMMQVYCTDQDKLETMLTKALSNSNIPSLEAAGVILVQSAKSSKLRIGIEGDRVAFYRQDGDVASFAGHRIPHTISIDDVDGVLEVLGAASRFHRQLETASEIPVIMELRKLQRDYNFAEDYKLMLVLTPIGENLIHGNRVDMVIDPEAEFGAMIHNRTNLPLYPYLFYFDCSNFSIIPWYVPPVGVDGRHVDPPLIPESTFPIGYGNDGAPPYEFFLPDGEKKDVGYFKLYLTTSPIDLSYISQTSAFESVRCAGASRKSHPDIWGSKLVTVYMQEA